MGAIVESNISSEHKIDYLQYSTHEVCTSFGDLVDMSKSPNRFYKYCQNYYGGVKVMSGNPNTDKSLVIMSGKSCELYRGSLMDIIRVEQSRGAKVSRIDLCVTVCNANALSKFNDELECGSIISKRYDIEGTKRIIDSKNNVETTYIGDLKKRARKGIFRAYDKAKEQGIIGDLARFELECKGDIANNNAKRLVGGTMIGNMIRKAVDIPDANWWVDIMGESTPLPKDMKESNEIVDEDQNRWDWLCTQVAPSLGKAIRKDELTGVRTANFERFNEAVTKAYNAYKHGD